MRGLLALMIVAAAALAAMPARAQVTFDGCYVGRGVPVASIPDPSINDIAYARLDFAGRPVIVYNPYVVNSTTPPTRVFFYFHECAHHVLGHTIGRGHPLRIEQEADCWAIRELMGRRLFGPRELGVVQSELAAKARGDWTHLPGPQRAINLSQCLRMGAAPSQGRRSRQAY